MTEQYGMHVHLPPHFTTVLEYDIVLPFAKVMA